MKKIKTGREVFDKYHIFIKMMITIIKMFPRKIRKTFLDLISYRKSKVFILIRYCIFYSLAKSCGKNVYIGTNVEFKGLENMEVGDNVSIHKDSYIDASGNIKIGDNVSIAHNTSIISENHTWEDKSLPIKYNNMKPKKIEIEEDVWIGAKTVILAGVHIGKRVVVAAGSIVTKKVENNVLVAGVPAKVIKNI